MGNVFSVSVSMEDTVNRCYNCTATRVNYTCKIKKNLKALDDALQELQELRDDVKQEVDRAEMQRLKPLNQVQGWLRRADSMIREAEELIDHGPQESEKLCFGGYFSSNCKSSYKFGKQVASKLEEIANLKSKGVFGKVAKSEPAAQVDVRPIAPTVGLESTLDKVWSLVEDNTNEGIVGLYGSGGVGKTTLLTQINNRLCSSMPTPYYDVVIWVVVSKDYFIDKVQDQIGEKIGLASELWKKKSCDEKATEIFNVLSKKKFVLLLDDLWKRVDLVKIGIPPLNEGSSSKLVFTTRSLDVCRRMEAHEDIRVEVLGEDEAWKLFREKVGEKILKGNPEIEELAKKVAAKCGGLPLALITIARAMACKKSLQEWQHAINVLQEAPYKFTELEDEVYPLLKFSYDSLPSDTMRSCLLYCSLYPEDYEIDKRSLIDYWFYEGFLDEFGDISRARLQGYNILGSLVNACLLEEIEDYYERSYVKVHDVIRNMTFWIARGVDVAETRVSLQGGVQLLQATNAGEWEGIKRMSIRVQHQITDVSATPTCPNLQTLFLHYNRIEVINDGFFQFMANLKVLNFSWNHDLRKLPEEISELVSLECLDLSWTQITVLPIKLKTLAKLKYLDLRVHKCMAIPRHLISSFPNLEVIKIFLWKFWKSKNGNEDVIEELGCLQHLKSASFEIVSDHSLEKLLTFDNLMLCTERLLLFHFREKSFDVLSLAPMESLKDLEIQCHRIEEMKMKMEMERAGRNVSNDCFRTLEDVTFSECHNLKEVTWLILAPNLASLKVIHCGKMEEIISEGKLSEVADMIGNQYGNPFGKLQSLHFRGLPKLKSIYREALPFPFLKRMYVYSCPNLRKLPFNSPAANGNHITIQGGKEWWKGLEWEDESTPNAFLPCFKELTGYY